MSRPTSPTEGESIISFLSNRLGQRIGPGECWDAAEAAIQSIGAQRPNSSELYVWGTSVTRDQVRVGDVLQFSNFRVRIDTEDSWTENELGLPRHTAVVESINSDGSVNLLHQNFDNDRTITRLSNLFINSSSSNGRTVSVSGSLTVYRVQMP
jgi:hypothetical protein